MSNLDELYEKYSSQITKSEISRHDEVLTPPKIARQLARMYQPDGKVIAGVSDFACNYGGLSIAFCDLMRDLDIGVETLRFYLNDIKYVIHDFPGDAHVSRFEYDVMSYFGEEPIGTDVALLNPPFKVGIDEQLVRASYYNLRVGGQMLMLCRSDMLNRFLFKRIFSLIEVSLVQPFNWGNYVNQVLVRVVKSTAHKTGEIYDVGPASDFIYRICDGSTRLRLSEQGEQLTDVTGYFNRKFNGAYYKSKPDTSPALYYYDPDGEIDLAIEAANLLFYKGPKMMSERFVKFYNQYTHMIDSTMT